MKSRRLLRHIYKMGLKQWYLKAAGAGGALWFIWDVLDQFNHATLFSGKFAEVLTYTASPIFALALAMTVVTVATGFSCGSIGDMVLKKTAKDAAMFERNG